MSRSQPSGPLTVEEADAVLAPFTEFSHVALAVSGGGDSMALLVLAAEWRDRQPDPPRLSVLSVDHRLRAEAADECRLVAERARGLGLPAEILEWGGDKPRTGLQSAARAARRRLLATAARRIGADAIALAHSRDDQAETILMRLARGSGPRGLAGMAARSEIDGIALLRPLLDIGGARLRASLAARSLDWIEDPSNGDDRFTRIRWRRLLPLLGELGLDAARLADFAGRMGRLDVAVGESVDRLMTAHVGADPDHPGGLRFEREVFASQPTEIRLRWLKHAIGRVGDGEATDATDKELQRLDAALATPPARRTLGGAVVSAGPRYVRVARQPPRRTPTDD
ncbi:MAG: tRNA lysidine(34) synthetase TilS [Hyphomicrobiaceae bacterium]|nr:tRNA lysidine(34) synthetase TilS [Hyphomicrobiaceae bacterium]